MNMTKRYIYKPGVAYCAIVVGALLTFGCGYNPTDYKAGRPDSLVSMSAMPDTIPADGQSTATILLVIQNPEDKEARHVTLTTTSGAFGQTGTNQSVVLTTDSRGMAETRLRAGLQVDEALLEASIGTLLTRAQVVFARAWPETCVVDPGGFTLAATTNATASMTAMLLRTVGKPTQGIAVVYAAVDSMSRPIGEFRGATLSDASGVSTVQFWVGQTSYRGPALITASVAVPGRAIIGSAKIQIVAP